MTDDALTKELDALRAHNAELLADLKKAKGKASELTTQVETLTAERDHAQAAVQAVKLDSPVAQMIERVAVAPDLFALQFAREYDFALDGDGIVIRDKEGNPATVTDNGKARPAQFTEADIRALCDTSPHKATYDHLVIATRASGGGAPGSRGVPVRDPSEQPKPKPARPAFGLT